MSAIVTSIPAGLSSIAVLSAARLNEPARRLPQMPSTEIGFGSLMVGLPCSAGPLAQRRRRDKLRKAGGGLALTRRGGEAGARRGGQPALVLRIELLARHVAGVVDRVVRRRPVILHP